MGRVGTQSRAHNPKHSCRKSQRKDSKRNVDSKRVGGEEDRESGGKIGTLKQGSSDGANYPSEEGRVILQGGKETGLQVRRKTRKRPLS